MSQRVNQFHTIINDINVIKLQIDSRKTTYVTLNCDSFHLFLFFRMKIGFKMENNSSFMNKSDFN